jgi:membrane fusion protein (multidrug efflux system)
MADRQDVSERLRDIVPDGAPAARVAPRADVPGKEAEVREVARDDRSTRQEDNLRKTERPPERRRVSWGGILGVLIVIVLVIAGVIYWWAGRNDESTDDAFTDGNAVIVAPHVTGYVTNLAVNDNQFVHAGQLLVKIDPRDFTAARDQAKGQLDLAEAQLRNANIAHEIAKTTFPARLQTAQAQLASAKATQAKAEADYRRYRSINPAATTREQIDTVNAALQQANAQVMQADAQVKEASLVPQNISEAEQQVSQWQAQVEQARAQLDQAELNLGYTDVAAPQDGWVTKRNVVQGNYVQAGTEIMALVSPQVWITANFKETQLTRMRAGQQVAISVDAYPFLHLKGHVDSLQEGSGSKFTAFPPENATGNYVKVVQRVPVKIVIDSGLDPNLPLPLGLSVEPLVHLK